MDHSFIGVSLCHVFLSELDHKHRLHCGPFEFECSQTPTPKSGPGREIAPQINHPQESTNRTSFTPHQTHLFIQYYLLIAFIIVRKLRGQDCLIAITSLSERSPFCLHLHFPKAIKYLLYGSYCQHGTSWRLPSTNDKPRWFPRGPMDARKSAIPEKERKNKSK